MFNREFRLTCLSLFFLALPCSWALAWQDGEKRPTRLVNGSFEHRKSDSPPNHIETLTPNRDDLTGWQIIDVALIKELIADVGFPERLNKLGQPNPGILPLAKTLDWIGPTRWRASHGDHCLDLDGGILQTIRTVAGQSYELRFDLAGNPEIGPRAQMLRVLVDDESHDFKFKTTDAATRNRLEWTAKRIVFKATNAKTTLTFVNVTPNVYSAGIALDNITLRSLDPKTLRSDAARELAALLIDKADPAKLKAYIGKPVRLTGPVVGLSQAKGRTVVEIKAHGVRWQVMMDKAPKLSAGTRSMTVEGVVQRVDARQKVVELKAARLAVDRSQK